MVYDKTWLQSFSKNHTDAKKFIEDSLIHVKAYYTHKTLGTKLIVETVGSIEYDSKSMSMCDSDKQYLRSKTLAHRSQTGADLVVYSIRSPACGAAGIAGCIGCVCIPNKSNRYMKPENWGFNTDNKHNLNKRESSIPRMARVSNFV